MHGRAQPLNQVDGLSIHLATNISRDRQRKPDASGNDCPLHRAEKPEHPEEQKSIGGGGKVRHRASASGELYCVTESVPWKAIVIATTSGKVFPCACPAPGAILLLTCCQWSKHDTLTASPGASTPSVVDFPIA